MIKTIMALNGVRVLSKEEQKKVTGGFCAVQGSNGSVEYFNYPSGNAERAQARARELGTHWCCASCGSASWMNPG